MKNQLGDEVIQNGVFKRIREDLIYKTAPVYEVIRLIGGMPLFFDEHMERFESSLDLVSAKCPFKSTDIFMQIQQLVEKENVSDNNVRLEYGETSDGWFLTLFLVISSYPDESVYKSGVKVNTANVVRKNPHAKVVNEKYLSQIADLKTETGAYEIILKDETGRIAEGSKSNLFFVKGNCLYSAREEDILIGITRLKVIEAMRGLGLSYREDDIFERDLSNYEAAFLSGTSIGVLPIETMNEIKYNSASNHVIMKLKEKYDELVESNLIKTRRQYR